MLNSKDAVNEESYTEKINTSDLDYDKNISEEWYKYQPFN